MKKKISVILIILITFVFAMFIIYSRMPHHITKAKEIKELYSSLEEVPIEKCDGYWKADMIFFGAVSESHSAGKIKVSSEYYNDILTRYKWCKKKGWPTEYFYTTDNKDLYEEGFKKSSKVFRNYIMQLNNEYYYSEEYTKEMGMIMCISINEPEIYYFDANM